MNYISQNHSKHLLMVHLIFSCKYRKKLLFRYGKLDADIVTGYGTETMVVENIRSDYLYTVVVTQNTYEVPLSDSNAVVRIYGVNGLVMKREVPTQLRPDLWGVAQWRSGNLVPIEISY